MMRETETNPTQNETPENDSDICCLPAPDRCLGVRAISQYKKMNPEITPDQFARIHAEFENQLIHNDFENAEADKILVEQSTLMDIAFRYYFGGGESGIINDDAFLLALKAQRQSKATLEFVRHSRRFKQRDQFQQEKYEYSISKRW
ncbi:MAG: hypothetical protein DI586_06905 [Micavibrio aeruginosavorus]|uniref:Uncharacterized protein n=1 Tax=Micavibrio aeruginosavorus TaxID=349221 RepID=A0A2W5FJL9_9BACT|nr:MAG: hypothetical protein DI586_06905 [Micavibrio aeruginosavorus]